MSLLVGLEFANDPSGSAGRPAPAAFAGISTAVKTAHWCFSDFLPSFFGFMAPSWLPDSLRYAWGGFDAQLAAWRAAGFTRVTVVLSARHPVLCAPSPGSAPSPVAGYAPKDDRGWAELTRFARAFVARYAGQVEIVQAESEQQVRYWWADELDAHLRWHRLLLRAVRELAGGRMRCFLGGHTFNGLLDDDPTDAEIERRIASLPDPRQSELRRAIDFGTRELSTGEFDGIEYHSLGDPAGIVPAFRRTLVPVPLTWSGELHVGDAFPGLPVLADANAWNPGQPSLYLGLLRGDPGVYAELERRQVVITQAKIDAARAAGCARLHAGPLYDWPLPNPYPWQGLTRPDGSLRPVCAAIRGAA